MKTALVADNDILFVEFLGELLEKLGYRVFKAFDGQEAITQVEKTPVNLFFVDIYMPKLDGRDVIRQVREKFSPDEMKIIAISGAARQTVTGLDELDFDAFLQKSALENMSKELDLLMDSLEKC